jgi:predicted DNA-binding transcriptional regulator AlpA
MLDESRRVLTEAEAAERLGIALSTLRRWRYDAKGPTYVKLGTHRVGYRLAAIEKWLEARTVGTAAA